MRTAALFWLTAAAAAIQTSLAWSTNDASVVSRRQAFQSAAAAAAAAAIAISPSAAAADDTEEPIRYERRNRNGNKDAIIREDYWYMMNRTPPRKLGGPLLLDDPQWNAFGTCATSDGDASTGNSCTYVSLKQRIPAYSKYGYLVGLGAREYQMLGKAIKNSDWKTAETLLADTSPPQAIVDSQLKMVLLASSLLTSPNYSGPSRELLVARYYVNETAFATREITKAVAERNAEKAMDVWDYGKDSWNSFFQIANGKITAKVGDKFEMIQEV